MSNMPAKRKRISTGEGKGDRGSQDERGGSGKQPRRSSRTSHEIGRPVVTVPATPRQSLDVSLKRSASTSSRSKAAQVVVEIPLRPRPSAIRNREAQPNAGVSSRITAIKPVVEKQVQSHIPQPVSARSAYQQRRAHLSAGGSPVAIDDTGLDGSKTSTKSSAASTKVGHLAAVARNDSTVGTISSDARTFAQSLPIPRPSKKRQSSPPNQRFHAFATRVRTNGHIMGRPEDGVEIGEVSEVLGGKQLAGAHTPLSDLFCARESTEIFNGDFRQASRGKPLSTFSPVWGDQAEPLAVNIKIENGDVLCNLRIGETIAFKGFVEITILHGAVRVGAANIEAKYAEGAAEASTRVIISPSSHPLPVIVAVDPAKSVESTKKYFSTGSTTVLRLRRAPHSIRELPSVQRVCPLTGIWSFASSDSTQGEWGIPGFFPIFASQPGQVPLQVWPSWQHALNLLKPQHHAKQDRKEAVPYSSLDEPVQPHASTSAPTAPIVLVRGAKRVGKSTLARMTLDTLLAHHQEVVFLEFDVGQPEFGPPGVVALHRFSQRNPPIVTPAWASARTPSHAHFVGDTSPRDDPTAYLAAVANLLEKVSALHFDDEYGDSNRLPVIINTCGWAKGLGSSLIARIEEMSQPTHIFTLEMPGRDTAPEVTQEALNTAPIGIRGAPYRDHLGYSVGKGPLIVSLPAAQHNESANQARSLAASDIRSLSMMTYFHSDLAFSHTSPRWNFSKALLAMPPYVLDVSIALAGGLHVLGFGAQVEDSLKLAALNGSVVGLVLTATPEVQQPDEAESASITGSVWQKALSQPLPAFNDTVCLGLGLIRSIDAEAGTIHLLTPIALDSANFDQRKTSLALVKGALDMPIYAALDEEAVAASRGGALANDSERQSLLAGVPREEVPFVSWPKDEEYLHGNEGAHDEYHIVSAKKRKVRRNLMRRGQQPKGR